jgi:hypothetical protein
MNALIYAINEINHQIPHDILQVGFTIDETPETINLTSLDDKILNKVLKKRVLIDTNIIGGIETVLPIRDIKPTKSEYQYTVYQIPSDLTMDKEIISALSLSVIPNTNSLDLGDGLIGMSPGTSLNGVTTRIGMAAGGSNAVINAHLELIGYNTILVYANHNLISNYGIRVLLENDNNLNNIQPRSYKAFSMFCVLATKAYLYNKLIIPVNNGMLAFGQDLGIFKDILESYSSAEEEYRTFMEEKMGVILFINDTTRMNRYIGSMIAPDL